MKIRLVLLILFIMVFSLVSCNIVTDNSNDNESTNVAKIETGGSDIIELPEKVQEYLDFINSNTDDTEIIQKGIDLFGEGKCGSEKYTTPPTPIENFQYLTFNLDDGMYIAINKDSFTETNTDKIHLWLYTKESDGGIPKEDSKIAKTTGDYKKAMLSNNYDEMKAILGTPSLITIELVDGSRHVSWTKEDSDLILGLDLTKDNKFLYKRLFPETNYKQNGVFKDFKEFENDFNLSYEEFLNKYFDDIHAAYLMENQKIFNVQDAEKEGGISIGIKNNDDSSELFNKYGLKPSKPEFRATIYYADGKFDKIVLID